jgi:hypothetical protein
MVMILALFAFFCGCRSINIGGSGEIGGVHGGGGVTIPVPPVPQK